MKILSWNVNGIRAIVKKNFFEDIEKLDADIICLQETKAQEEQVKEVLADLEGYHLYANSAERKGYSGTAVLSKNKPIHVTKDIHVAEHNKEGRVLCAEYPDFYLVNVYVPNSGSALKRLDYRQEWDIAFYEYLKELNKSKPVIACGDFNVAHKNIDLANPESNYNKSAGFMQEEIDGMDRLLSDTFDDTFRYFKPDLKEAYTWWSYRTRARERNVGWRIDYFLVSKNFMSNVKTSEIHSDIYGSDHCPVSLELN